MGANTLSAFLRIDDVSSAYGLVGTPRPAIPAKPGDSSTLLNSYSVRYSSASF